MKLSSILRNKKKVDKKKQVDPNYQIELGELMKKAAAEPAYRKVFFDRFLTEKIHVVVLNQDLPTGTIDVTKTKSITLMTLPDGRIPIFTSPQRIFERGFVKGDKIRFISLSGRSFLQGNSDKNFVINPFSDYGRNIKSDEVKKILDGTQLYDTSHETIISDNEKIELGMPKVYPGEALKDLIHLYRDYPEVSEAYISIIRHPGVFRTPNYLFAIRTSENYDEIAAETGIAVEKYASENQVFEVMHLDGTSHFEKFFEMVPPFYKRGM